MIKNRLLLVDDEPSIRITLSVILQQEGFEVTTAATVAEALGYIAKQPFDVLLSDLNIGQKGDGFTVVSAMRRTQPEAATFIVTGFPDFETAVQALRDQVDDYFTKPTDVKALVARIRAHDAVSSRLPHAQLKRISAVLRENAAVVLERWVEAAVREPELSRVSLSRKERIDHLPGILEELCDRVDSQRFETSKEAREAARQHGHTRKQQGYNAHQIVLEARILHAIISRTLESHLLSIDMSTLTSDLMHVGEGLNELLEESVRAFEEVQPFRRVS